MKNRAASAQGTSVPRVVQSRRSRTMMALASMGALVGFSANLHAYDNNSISIWTGPAAAGGTTVSPVTGNWSDPTAWNVVPVSGINTELQFGGVGGVPYDSSNDTGSFTLNTIQLFSTSPATETIDGSSANNTLTFASSSLSNAVLSPQIIQNTSGPFNIAAPIFVSGPSSNSSTSNLIIAGNGTAGSLGAVTLSGAMSFGAYSNPTTGTNNVNAASLIINNPGVTNITGSMAFSVSNSYLLVPFSGGMQINSGTVNISGSASVTAVGVNTASGSLTTNQAPSLQVGGPTGQGVLNISTSGTVLFTTPDIGGSFEPSSVTANPTTKQAAGAVYQTNGTMVFTNNTFISNYLSIGSGYAASGAVGGYGAYILSGGSLTANNVAGGGGIRVGAVGPGVLVQTGGSITPDRAFLLGTYGTGVATFAGGTFTGTAGASVSITYVGDTAGTGFLNIGTEAGGNAVFTNQSTQLGTSNGTGFIIGNTSGDNGTVNIDSGTLAFVAGGIYKGAGTATLNLDGGTIQAAAAGLTLIGSSSTYLLPAKIYHGGVTIDTQSYTASISAPLTSTIGNGLYPTAGMISIPSFAGNSGYIAPPLVSITDTTNPSATGATAIANVSNGIVTGVTLTSPGSGYAVGDNLSFTFTGGESGTVAAYYTTVYNYSAGATDIATNTGGALNKIGSGLLNLTGTNTYIGVTNINNGTLDTSLVVSLPGYNTPNAIVVQSGATLALGVGGTGQFNASNIQSVTANANFISGSILGLDTTSATAGFTYNGSISGSVGLTKLGTNALLLGGTGTYTGPTLVSAGTLLLNSPAAIGGTSGVMVSNGAALSVGDNTGFAGFAGGITGGSPINTNLTGTGVSSNGALRGADGVTATYAGNINLSPYNGSNATSIAGGANGTLILTGTIGGSGPLLFAGNSNASSTSTVVLNATGTYSGETQINGASNSASSTIVKLGINNALSTSGGLNFLGTNAGSSYLDLNGHNQSVQYLNGTVPSSKNFTGIINSAASAPSTLTITNGNSSNYSARIADNNGSGGTVAVALASGTQTFSGTSTYSGGTTIAGGTLIGASNNAFGTGTVTLAGGTLSLGAQQKATVLSGFNNFSLNNANASGSSTAPAINAAKSVLTLTDTNNQEGTSSFSPATNISTPQGFVASFTYTPTANQLVGGAAFVIQNDSQAAVGSPGIGLGYAVDSVNYNSSNAPYASAIFNSAAFEINVASTYTIGVAFDFGGTLNKTFTSSNLTLYSGDPINVVYTDNPGAGTITAQLTDSKTSATQTFTYTQTSSANANFANVLGGNSAYIGFSGGVGGGTNTQNISNFTFANIFNGPVAIANPITAAAGTTSTLLTSITPGFTVQNVGAVTINSSATLVIAANVSSSGLIAVLATPSVSVASVNGSYLGKLDIGTNDLDITAQPILQVNKLVAGAYASGTWTGNGITSSAAMNDTHHLTAVAVIANNQGGTALYGSGTTLGLLDGDSPGTSDVLVKYTYYGDIDLTGVVDGTDYSRIDNAYANNKNASNAPLTGWFNGDFNYDAVINGSDYTLMDNAFNTQGASLASAVSTAQVAPISAVPEPTAALLVGVIIASALGRRRCLRGPRSTT